MQLGDFNASVEKNLDAWSGILGPYRVGNVNENDQRLLKKYTFLILSIMNSFFRTKLRHAVTWRLPRSGHCHELNLTVAQHESRPKFLHTKSYHSADFNTYHALVCSKIRLDSQRKSHTTQGSSKRLGI